MVVAVVQEFLGGTVEQYDQVLEKMGLRAGAAGPPGQLFHWVAATDKGLLITDVWESAEKFQQWAVEKTRAYGQGLVRKLSPHPRQSAAHSTLTILTRPE